MRGVFKEGLDSKKLLEIYKSYWKDEGYKDKKERDEYFKLGQEMCKNFVADLEETGRLNILALEKSFMLKIGGYGFKGAIDRIDELENGNLEVIDYKTGGVPKQFYYKQKKQLLLYKIALEEILGRTVEKMTFYYLKDKERKSFEASEKDIVKVKEEIVETINAIISQDFRAKPGMLCSYCDFRGICEYRQI